MPLLRRLLARIGVSAINSQEGLFVPLKETPKMEVKNELGVIVKFSKECSMGNITILDISDAYPDALVKRGDKEYRVEFEFKASNFLQHNHDIRECDLIICWEDDLSRRGYPVVSINQDGWWNNTFPVYSQEVRDVLYWRHRARRAEKLLKTARQNDNKNEMWQVGEILILEMVDNSLIVPDLSTVSASIRQEFILKLAETGTTKDKAKAIHHKVFGKSHKTFDRDVANCNGQLVKFWGE